MDKLLTIVIPRFRETEREIFPLLSSISNQTGIDMRTLEVIIVTDGGGGSPLDENFLALFGFETKQLRLERNSGCGVARQAAIDIARGEYILCCDADDVLYSVTSLYSLLSEAKAVVPDLLISDFLEEVPGPDGRMSYLTHTPSGAWMHGKLLRREFLLEHNIRFHDNLDIHEDSYYLCLASSLAKNMRYLAVPTYVWKYNPESITRRRGGAYAYEQMPVYIKVIAMAWEVVERLHPEQMMVKVVQFVHNMFFTLHRVDWMERRELLDLAEQAFAEQIGPWMRYYREAGPVALAEIYNTERGRKFQGGVEVETLAAWLDRLRLAQKISNE